MFRFKHLFGRAGYYFFMFKTIICLLWSGQPPPAPQPRSGQSLFPSASASASALLLHNHAGFFFFLPFSRPSLWHLLAKISRLLPWNPRHGNASLGIAAAVRTDGLQPGFCVSALLFFSLCFVFVLVLLGLRRSGRVWFWNESRQIRSVIVFIRRTAEWQPVHCGRCQPINHSSLCLLTKLIKEVN